MSGAPVPIPEVLIAQHRAQNPYLDESALDDESDSELDVPVHTSSAHRFSRRLSQNASQTETAGILSTKERRASRRESQVVRDSELLNRRGAGGDIPSSGVSTSNLEQKTSTALDNIIVKNAGSTSSLGSDTVTRPGVAPVSSTSAISSSPASLLRADSGPGLPARRLSRTAQIIAEERGTGSSTGSNTQTATPHPLSQGISIPSPAIGFTINESIKEVDTVPPTPAAVEPTEQSTFEVIEEEDPRATGKIASWRGATILATACFAQLVDNIWMTSINIAVPRIAEEFDLLEGSQSWLVSAYTLTFGGFLLLAGVLSDRFGRRYVFSLGMLSMMVFSIACGVSRSGVQCIIFRALQGLGAAASVPSAIGVLSNFFVGNERHRALSMFGAAGAVGFVVGLILGGILSGTLGWRYIFYVNAPIIFILAISGWVSFPSESENRTRGGRKPSLDFPGAALGTSGMVLMTFALSQSEVSGWNKPVIIVTLILSVLILLGFTYAERRVPNPIMPTYLWKLPSFAGIWCSGFLLYCWWASIVYYLALIAQEVLFLSPLTTGLYMIPMGSLGFVVSISMGRAVEKFELKHLLIAGFFISVVGTLPAAFVKAGGSFWALVFPTTLLAVTGVSIGYNVASIALVSAVPPAAKSLAGGLINTAFQIGSGFGLAITSLVNESVLKKTLNPEDPSSIMKGYQAALFTSCGLVGGSLILSLFAVRAGQQATAGMIVH